MPAHMRHGQRLQCGIAPHLEAGDPTEDDPEAPEPQLGAEDSFSDFLITLWATMVASPAAALRALISEGSLRLCSKPAPFSRPLPSLERPLAETARAVGLSTASRALSATACQS